MIRPPPSPPQGGLSASGGGVSTVFAKPSWQTALTFADGHRDVPDVSLNASPAHDGSLICSQAAVKSNGSNATSCSAGFRDSAGNLSPVGGTSVGAPAFAGIVAILNQATQSGGLGNINPTLYSLGGTGAFHDITTGNNIVPCTSGTPVSGSASIRCPTSAPFQLGYSAAAGYDLVTGLGSINANVLATSWPGFVLTPNFSVGGTPVSVASAGQGGTSTVTVTPTNGFVGTVDLACALTPASTTAGVTCSIPASVSLNGSSQAASLTISTTAPHVLSGTRLIAGPAWNGLAGEWQHRAVRWHFLPGRALAPSSHDGVWTHAPGILCRRRGLWWRKQQRRFGEDRRNTQRQLQHHSDGHQRLVDSHRQCSCNRAVGHVGRTIISASFRAGSVRRF